MSGADCWRVSFVYTPRRIWQKGGQPLFSGSNELFLAVLTIFLVPVRYRRLLALAFVLVGMSTGMYWQIGYLIGWWSVAGELRYRRFGGGREVKGLVQEE